MSKVIASWKLASEIKEENRYILKFYYKKKGRNATLTAKKISDVYRHDAVSVFCVAQSWFKLVFNLEIFMFKMFDTSFWSANRWKNR